MAVRLVVGTRGFAFALAAIVAALLLAGCGGGGDSTSSAAIIPGTATAARDQAKSFLTPGGDNSIQIYGKEAGAAEREAASTMLESYMAARAAEDWERACTIVVPSTVDGMERLVVPGGGCVATLTAFAEGLAPGAWDDTMTGPIDSLRVKDVNAFALYHGTGGTDYFVQMTTQFGGVWKVAALEPTAFP